MHVVRLWGDKTMMKLSALPPGVKTLLGRKRQVTSVTAKCALGPRGTYQRHDFSRVLCNYLHIGTNMCHHYGQC
jgi:hypothetical protein